MHARARELAYILLGLDSLVAVVLVALLVAHGEEAQALLFGALQQHHKVLDGPARRVILERGQRHVPNHPGRQIHRAPDLEVLERARARRRDGAQERQPAESHRAREEEKKSQYADDDDDGSAQRFSVPA
jgi:hypothetical protein